MPSLTSASLQVRDWYVESFAELRRFPTIKDAADEAKFTELLKSIYQRHRFASALAFVPEHFHEALEAFQKLELLIACKPSLLDSCNCD